MDILKEMQEKELQNLKGKKFQTRVKRDIKFKSGVEFKAGDAIDVSTNIKDGRPQWGKARVENLTAGTTIVFNMLHLNSLSDDFVTVTQAKIERACFASVVESMTGKRVEPDGYDEYGLPSIGMAAGII